MMLSLITTIFTLASVATAQTTEINRITAADADSHDHFGNDVAVYGDTLVVGAPDDEHLPDLWAGSAYVFERDGLDWVQHAKLEGLGIGEGDRFGGAVEIHGNTIAVGAWGADGVAYDTGNVHIFERSGGVWTQTQIIDVLDGKETDLFGWSLAMDYDTLVVGARRNDPFGLLNSGAVYVFTHNGQSWTQQAKLTAADGAVEDNFGMSVALHGETILIGAPFDDDHGDGSGSAYVFTRIGSTWTQQAKLTYVDGRPLDLFGYDVSLTADRALVGAYRAKLGVIGRDAGAGFVFERSGGIWSQTAKLLSESLQLDDDLGHTVEIDGDIAVLGARGHDGDRGKFVHFRLLSGTWTELGEGVSSLGSAGDQFSYSMDLDGERLVVAAHLADLPGKIDAGAVGIFPLYRLDMTPDPLIAGKRAVATVTGCTPNTKAYLVASSIGLGSYWVPQFAVMLELDTPFIVTYPVLADAKGTAIWTLTMPTATAGMSFWLQSLQFFHATNLTAVVVK